MLSILNGYFGATLLLLEARAQAGVGVHRRVVRLMI